MKNLKVKSILFSLLAMMAVAVFMTSCNSSNNNNSTTCNISGPSIVDVGTIITLSYTSDLANPSVEWETSINITLISGQGTPTATFLVNGDGSVIAYGVDGVLNCSESYTITAVGGPTGGSTCACPSPVIVDESCVSGGHPHWRFRVDGIDSSDQITWTINHGTIHANPNGSYVIIEPNSGSTAGFTVYCETVRTCPDGTTKERTAYYTNYYGNSCGTGTTGFTDSCGGGV